MHIFVILTAGVVFNIFATTRACKFTLLLIF